MVKLNPMTRYEQPGYPVRPEVDADPELLRLLPKRWQGNAVVVAALTAVIALSSSSRSMGDKKAPPTRVAPLFQHGDGRGAFGCRVVNPPVFLSEDEAREVIVGEAKRAGIKFSNGGKVLPKVAMTMSPTQWRTAAGRRPKPQTRALAVELDGVDSKRNISFEYVSKEDLVKWKGDPRALSASTVYGYDVIDAADELRKAIRNAKPSGTYAVFYDPVELRRIERGPGIDFGVAFSKAAAAADQLAREDLRKQVQDFIKWLKTQGVI